MERRGRPLAALGVPRHARFLLDGAPPSLLRVRLIRSWCAAHRACADIRLSPAAQAVALLRRSVETYRNTSIRSRLQKNLNVLGLAGQPAPPLKLAPYLGPKPVALSQLNGSPVLLFFWAHWCGDCKAEGPVIAQLSSEFGSRGLMLLAPTQLYGYGARGEDATPKDELPYVERVWQHFYPALRGVPVPVSKENFNLYGASTTPTLVLLDRAGRVALYHPGVMPYEDLRAAIAKVVR